MSAAAAIGAPTAASVGGPSPLARLFWLVSFVWLGLLIALPVGVILLSSIHDDGFTLDHYLAFAGNRALLTAALNSLLVASGIAILSVLVGAPLAFGVVRTKMRFKGLVRASIIVALISPEFLLAMGYILLAGPNAGYVNLLLRNLLGLSSDPGPLNIFSLGGLVVTALPNGAAFVFLALVPALRNMDPALEEAARMKGSSALRAAWDITLPLMRPALLAGALLAFSTSLAMFGPPQMLRIDVLTVAIRDALIRLNFATASVAAVALIAMSLGALLMQRRALRHGERYRTLGGKAFDARQAEFGLATHVLSGLGLLYVFGALIVPYGAMLAASLMKSIGNGFSAGNWTLDNYRVILTDPGVYEAALLSLQLAAASATLVAAMGLLIAYVIARTRTRGRALLDYLSVLPLAIPGTALAFALIVLHLAWPVSLLGLYGTPFILLVAYLARFVPIGVRNSQSALLQIAPELEEASRVFGGSEAATLLRITAPLILPSVVYTWLLVFILAMPELGSSIILRGFGMQTLSTALLGIWSGNGGLAVASAFGMTIFVVVATVFGVAALVARRSPALRGLQLG
jgi:iron(III) transport system permease protein